MAWAVCYACTPPRPRPVDPGVSAVVEWRAHLAEFHPGGTPPGRAVRVVVGPDGAKRVSY